MAADLCPVAGQHLPALPLHTVWQVYVTRLPREATDKQVLAFCETAGDVYSVRLPKDPADPSRNKG